MQCRSKRKKSGDPRSAHCSHTALCISSSMPIFWTLCCLSNKQFTSLLCPHVVFCPRMLSYLFVFIGEFLTVSLHILVAFNCHILTVMYCIYSVSFIGFFKVRKSVIFRFDIASGSVWEWINVGVGYLFARYVQSRKGLPFPSI